MPEQGGINRSVVLPQLPRTRLSFTNSLALMRSPADRLEFQIQEIKAQYDAIVTYLAEQQVAIATLYDVLAQRLNELPEMIWLPFGRQMSAGLTDEPMGNGISDNGFVAPEEGSIVALAVRSQNPRTAGTLTVEPMVNGTGSGFTLTLDGTNATSNQALQDQGLDIFTRKDLVGCRCTTTADWAPDAAGVDVVVGIVVARGLR